MLVNAVEQASPARPERVGTPRPPGAAKT